MGRLMMVATALVLATALLAGCKKPVPAGASGYSYKDLDDYMALDMPAGWERRDKVDDAKVVFLSPPAAGPAQVEIRVRVLPKVTSDLNEYLGMIKAASQSREGAKEIQAKVAQHKNGKEGCLTEYEYTEMGTLMHVKQWAILANGKQYVVTATVPGMALQQLMPQVDKILDSLIIW